MNNIFRSFQFVLNYLVVQSFGGLILGIVLCGPLAFSQQELQIDWEKTLSNTNGVKEKLLWNTRAQDGYGYFSGYISTQEGPRMYLTRHDSLGNKDWERILPSSIRARIDDHVLYEDDIFVLGNENFASAGAGAIHYAKINSEGEVAWHYTLDEAPGMEADASQIIVANDTIFIRGSQRSENGYDVGWLAALDLQGQLLWKTVVDQGMETTLLDLEVNTQGNVAACGWLGNLDSLFLLGLKKDGPIDWQYSKSFSDSSSSWFMEINSDAQGNWIVTGSEAVGAYYENDAVIYKFNTNGDQLWRQHFNNGNLNVGVWVSLAPSGNIVSISEVEEFSSRSLRIASYDPAGNELWTSTYSAGDYMYLNDAILSDSGFLYLNAIPAAYARYSPSGQLVGDRKILNDSFFGSKYLGFDGKRVWGCGSPTGRSQASIFSLGKDRFETEFFKTSTGHPMSDVQVNDIVSQGEKVWLSNRAVQNDTTNVLSVHHLDNQGDIIWTIDQEVARTVSPYDFFALDAAENTLLFYVDTIEGNYSTLKLSKYDGSGNKIFDILCDSPSHRLLPLKVTTDQNHNIFVCGHNKTRGTLFISKFLPNGEKDWTVEYPDSEDVSPYKEALDMVVSPQGKVVIAVDNRFISNEDSLHLLQYDQKGVLEWKTEVVDQRVNLASFAGLQTNKQGQVTVFGSTGSRDFVAAQLNANGSPLWTHTGLLDSEGDATNMVINQSGNTYLCFSSTPAQIVKLDPSGNTVATAKHDLENYSGFMMPSSAHFINGRLVIIGANGPGTGARSFEMVLDEDLNLVSGFLNSGSPGLLKASDLNENNQIHIAFQQGPRHVLPAYRRALLRQYSMRTLSVHPSRGKIKTLEFYPNPARDQVDVSIPGGISNIETVAIYDMDGRIVQEFGKRYDFVDSQTFRLQLPLNLLPGAYIVRVTTSEGEYSGRLMKQ